MARLGCDDWAALTAHLSQLLDADLSIPITVKQGEGLLQAVDVAGSDLPVRADPEGGGPRHEEQDHRSSAVGGGKPSTAGLTASADQQAATSTTQATQPPKSTFTTAGWIFVKNLSTSFLRSKSIEMGKKFGQTVFETIQSL